MVSAYVLKRDPTAPEFFTYRMDDRYMTVRKYASDEKSDVLSSEGPEILARLKRAKAERIKTEAERRAKTPR